MITPDRRHLLLAAGFLALAGVTAEAQQFRHITTYKGLGSIVASSVGPGPKAGSERYYLSYLFVENTIDVVSIDPRTGAFEVFPNPVATESGARSMVLAPDGNLYLGTLPKAHFYKLDPKAGKLTDLGRPSPTEEYIWDLAVGTDKKVYGVTYPQARLVRCDPASGKLDDLGRMDPVEQYARRVAASDDGFVYIAIGTSKSNIAVYEIASGTHREILPPEYQITGIPTVHRAASGRIYSQLGKTWFRLKGWSATPIPESEVEPQAPTNVLADGSTVNVEGRSVLVTDARTKQTTAKPYGYDGNLLNVFRLGFGPDGKMYGSAVLPIDFLRLNDAGNKFDLLGPMGGGEFYSFLAHGKWMLGAAYSAFSPLMKFDVARPFDLKAPVKNPVLVNFPGSDSSWRPQAMVEGPDGKVYLGAISGYGKLGGPLVVWDTQTDQVKQYPHVVRDQSVNSLGVWKNLIVGGTNIGGGGGSHPSETQAKLFLWDTATNSKTFEVAVEQGGGHITDLIGASNGLVYFISGRSLFVFDPATRTFRDRKPLPFRHALYNSIAEGEGGALWGLASEGIFRVDLKTNQVTLAAPSPRRITAGFALRNGSLYFVIGSEVWAWTLPKS